MAILSIDITATVNKLASLGQALTPSAIRSQLASPAISQILKSPLESKPELPHTPTPLSSKDLVIPQISADLADCILLAPAKTVSLSELVFGLQRSNSRAGRPTDVSSIEITVYKTYSAAELMLSKEVEISHRALNEKLIAADNSLITQVDSTEKRNLPDFGDTSPVSNSHIGMLPINFRSGVSQFLARDTKARVARFQSDTQRHPIFKLRSSRRPSQGFNTSAAGNLYSAGFLSRVFNKLTRN